MTTCERLWGSNKNTSPRQRQPKITLGLKLVGRKRLLQWTLQVFKWGVQHSVILCVKLEKRQSLREVWMWLTPNLLNMDRRLKWTVLLTMIDTHGVQAHSIGCLLKKWIRWNIFLNRELAFDMREQMTNNNLNQWTMAFTPKAIVEIVQNVAINKCLGRTVMMQAHVCILAVFCPYPDHIEIWSLFNIWRAGWQWTKPYFLFF